ncbi:hypothetical protein [Qipengyuania thermophila]|uniref:hypothetical protein n=1 Tax=Qipengyuania thermophila TaxID=2509361 RepID=UPI0018F89D56|nr:hypothetical protein [Qipengyuania thermophila]
MARSSPPSRPARSRAADTPAADAGDRAAQTVLPGKGDGAAGALTCTRKLRRQATSRTAWRGAAPGEDDPLLEFAPYLHPRPRLNSITPERQRAFVAHLAATGIVSQAARHIGKSMEALYKLRARPGAEGFAAAWDAALERGVQRLEDCALERALRGTPTPIVGPGGVVGWWDKPDNALLRFLLQHRLPERYGVQNLKPGHPVYDSIAAEAVAAWEKAQAIDEEALYASIDAKLDALRREPPGAGTGPGTGAGAVQDAVAGADSGKKGMRTSSGAPSSSSKP